jgi:hypothetical protein
MRGADTIKFVFPRRLDVGTNCTAAAEQGALHTEYQLIPTMYSCKRNLQSPTPETSYQQSSHKRQMGSLQVHLFLYPKAHLWVVLHTMLGTWLDTFIG